jgi:hypothetical protein
MLGFDHDADPLWLQLRVQAACDLGGEPLLQPFGNVVRLNGSGVSSSA